MPDLSNRKIDDDRTLDEIALECFGPEHGVDLELPPRRPHEPIDFSE